MSFFLDPLLVCNQQISCTQGLFSHLEIAGFRSVPNSSKRTGHLSSDLKKKDQKMEGKEFWERDIMDGWMGVGKCEDL